MKIEFVGWWDLLVIWCPLSKIIHHFSSVARFYFNNANVSCSWKIRYRWRDGKNIRHTSSMDKRWKQAQVLMWSNKVLQILGWKSHHVWDRAKLRSSHPKPWFSRQSYSMKTAEVSTYCSEKQGGKLKLLSAEDTIKNNGTQQSVLVVQSKEESKFLLNHCQLLLQEHPSICCRKAITSQLLVL